MSGTAVNSGLAGALSLLGHRKLNTVAFLGAAQVDRFGNLNSTSLGPYDRPTARFPGAGGACDAASAAAGFIIFMQHEKRRFVEKLDYRTSPGWLSGGDSRKRAGFPRGGPLAVVTNLGVMRFEESTKAMYLAEYYPGVSPRDVADNTGFELDLSRSVAARPPDDRELTALRTEVDPQRLILG
jgi:glutaconate CoA-transferase subunit B